METVLVLADTHLPNCDVLPDWLENALTDVSLVIHAGDFTSRSFYEQLGQRVALVGVIGNMDNGALIGRLSERLVVDVEGVTIGVTHGLQGPAEIARTARSSFGDVDLIVFGHTHAAFDGTVGGMRMFNPGSPTRPRDSNLGSYGVLTVHQGAWRSRHIRIGDSFG
jgi:uncharacterized protein